MKLPWDKEYIKISFHVIVTLIVIYAIALVIKNAPTALIKIEQFFAYIADVLSPLIIAVIFSYIMNPVVEKLQGFCDKIFKLKHKGVFRKRIAGTAMLYLIVFVLLVTAVILAVNGLGDTNINVIEQKIKASVYGFTGTLRQFNEKLAELGIIQNEDGIFDSIMYFIKNGLNNVYTYFSERITSIGGFLLDLLIGLTVSFYLLMEKERIVAKCRDIIKAFMPKHADKILFSLHEADNVFSGYISGQITDAFVMAALVSISLLIIGVDYPFIIGVISGFSNLIPYVGAVAAFVLAVSVALISGNAAKALYAAVVIILLQQLDSAVIVPKIVGKRVKLHPVLVILALTVFGRLFGILGMVFAVPVTALIKIIFDRIYANKKINIRKS